MPLYEYACRKCEHTFEELVFNGEAVECPECHGRKVERLLSVPGPPKVKQSLPMSCDPRTPPCGPGCCKL
jgi:putative FmdB family regulatory protein